ncbi:DUF4158 domain-containing protein [Streptomyces mirabilis]|nr:DUF4158 domain-containing protein [Streptomyces mirabilis]
MPVEFLTDEQAAAYAAYRGAPSRTELERFFFLDDADRELIESKRRAHNRLGFAAQLTTARYLGVFVDDPTSVPPEVVDYLAEQLDIGDPSVLKVYGERENTRLEHMRELRRVLEYREFAEAEAELREWVDARAWTTGEGAARGRLRGPRRGRGPTLPVRAPPHQRAGPVLLPAPRPARRNAAPPRPGRCRRVARRGGRVWPRPPLAPSWELYALAAWARTARARTAMGREKTVMAMETAPRARWPEWDGLGGQQNSQ